MARKRLSEDEYKQMIAQMDRDLEQFVLERIEANKDIPKEPFDFNKLETEITNHPAFMTEWDPSKPMTPELEALIQLKYNECDDLNEKATNYKEDGNQNFKIGKYRWAIDNYTVAIQCNCPDKLINAVCYTNRAAAQFRLGNYRTAFRDCVLARRFVPDHMKAIVRGIHSCIKTKKYEICQRWIEEGLMLEPDHVGLLKLRQECEALKKDFDRDIRKQISKERKEDLRKKALLDVIKARGIKLRGVHGEDLDPQEDIGNELESLFGKTSNAEASNARVFVDDFGFLHWPVLLMYPEYGQTDFITQANERTCLEDLLYQVFGPDTPPASWDCEKKYRLENLLIYFEDRESDALCAVSPQETIQSLLSNKMYIVYGGLPCLIVLVKDCVFTSDFLKKYTVMQ